MKKFTEIKKIGLNNVSGGARNAHEKTYLSTYDRLPNGQFITDSIPDAESFHTY